MNVRSILVNVMSMSTMRIGLAGLTFALFWVLSHRLSSPQLGGFSTVMNLFFLGQALSLLGMNIPLMRRIAAKPEDADTETSSAFFFAIPVAAILCSGVLLAGWRFADPGLLPSIDLLGLSLLPTAWTVVAECVLIGQERMSWVVWVNLLEALGRLVGMGLVVNWGYGLTAVFAVFAILRFAVAIGYACAPRLPLPRWKAAQSERMHVYRQEAPTYFSIAIITGLCARVDLLLIARVLSLSDAGIYAAASRLSDAALMVPTMALVVMFPTQARLYETDRVAFARFFRQAIRYCLMVGFAVALLVIAMSPWVIQTLYAPRLSAAAPVLQILILGTTVMVIDQLLSTTMIAAHAQGADLRSMSVGLGVLVCLVLLLAHVDGLIGAAIAAPIALLARVLYRLHWAGQEFSQSLLWPTARIMLSAGAAACVMFFKLTGNAVTDLGLALVVYGIALWMTRSVSTADWRLLSA